jgi:hypothetical protein
MEGRCPERGIGGFPPPGDRLRRRGAAGSGRKAAKPAAPREADAASDLARSGSAAGMASIGRKSASAAGASRLAVRSRCMLCISASCAGGGELVAGGPCTAGVRARGFRIRESGCDGP